jgi:hypothetical protein
VPFGRFIVPKLGFLTKLLHGTSLSAADAELSLAIDPIRLKQQVIYFAVTGQALQAIEENIVPWFTRTLFAEAKKISHYREDDSVNHDKEPEREFLRKIRHQLELPEYEVYEDYAEMVVQVRHSIATLTAVRQHCPLVHRMAADGTCMRDQQLD